MATVVNTPGTTTSDSSGGMGFLLGVVLLIIFAVLFFLYGLPYLTQSMQGPQVNVPGKVDVNVNTPNAK
jgi:hypothetical protein